MTFQEFKTSLTEPHPPAKLDVLLKALWHDAKGDWEKAHDLAQEVDNTRGAWVHAFLHRKEGDHSNAAYWYARANKKMPAISLQQEWKIISQALLEKQA